MQAPNPQNDVAWIYQDQHQCLPALQLPLMAGSLQSCMDGTTARNTECSVCYEDFDANSHIIVHTECRNGFHVTCMEDWIERLSREATEDITCPICRGILPLDNNEAGVAAAYWREISDLAEDVHEWCHVSHMKNWLLSKDLYDDLTVEMQDVEEWPEWGGKLQSDPSDHPIENVREAVDDFTTEVRRFLFQRVFYNRALILRTTVARALASSEADIFQGKDVAAVRHDFRRAFSAFVDQLAATSVFPPGDRLAHRFKIRNRFQRIRQASFLAAPDAPNEASHAAVSTLFYQIMQTSIPSIIEDYDNIMSFYLARWVLASPGQDAELRSVLRRLLADFDNVALVTKYSGRVARWSEDDLLKHNAS